MGVITEWDYWRDLSLTLVSDKYPILQQQYLYNTDSEVHAYEIDIFTYMYI